MRRSVRWCSVLILQLCVAAMGCGGVTNGTYAGEPLAVIEGELTKSTNADINANVRVALGWINAKGNVNTIAPQEVEYRPLFPLKFRLPIYEVPPELAMFTNAGYRYAIGQVIVYQDLNSNKKLDIIPKGGRPIDRVLGKSGLAGYIVYYFSDLGPSALSEMDVKLGFNLSHNTDLIPNSTTIPIQINASVWNNLLVCSSSTPINWIQERASGGELACICERPGLRVFGQITYTASAASVRLLVADCERYIDDAVVLINGTEIPFAPQLGKFGRIESSRTFLFDGTNEIRVSASGHEDLTVWVPLRILRISSPKANATMPSDVPIEVSWNGVDPSFNTSYAVDIFNARGSRLLRGGFTPETRFKTPTVSFSGQAQLKVTGLSMYSSSDGSMLGVTTWDTVDLRFEP